MQTMDEQPASRSALRLDKIDAALLGMFALIKVLIHLACLQGYGIFRDELYYLDCANHLAWGYVDHPPFSIAILAAVRALLGDAIWAIRLPVIIIGAVTVVFGGLIARRLGGGRFALVLSCLSFLIAGVYLGQSTYFSMNAFDLFFWAWGAYLLAGILQSGNPRGWLWFGMVAGLGLQNKLSMGFFGAGLVIAMAFTPERRFFFDRRLYMGGVLALLLVLPNILWQILNGAPTLEFMGNAALYKNSPMWPHQYAAAQLLMLNPLNVLVWGAGLFFGLFAAKGKRFRLFSIAYLAIFAIFVLTRGKTYYLSPAYAMIIPLGAVWWEGFTDSRRALRPLLLGVLMVSGIVVAPFALPVLPPETFLRYQAAIGIEPPREEKGHTSPLPQHFGDRFGWEDMVKMFGAAYNGLDEVSRAKCTILTSNYGEAGAINYYGKQYGLPHAISGHNSYFIWGPGNATGEVMLVFMGSEEELRTMFEEVKEVARFHHPYAMPYENGRALFLCRGLKTPLGQAWPGIKNFG